MGIESYTIDFSQAFEVEVNILFFCLQFMILVANLETIYNHLKDKIIFLNSEMAPKVTTFLFVSGCFFTGLSKWSCLRINP